MATNFSEFLTALAQETAIIDEEKDSIVSIVRLHPYTLAELLQDQTFHDLIEIYAPDEMIMNGDLFGHILNAYLKIDRQCCPGSLKFEGTGGRQVQLEGYDDDQWRRIEYD